MRIIHTYKALLIIGLSLLASCIYIPEHQTNYPTKWGKIIKHNNDGCININGIYKNDGQGTLSNSGGYETLWESIYGGTVNKISEIATKDYIEVKQVIGGNIKLNLWGTTNNDPIPVIGKIKTLSRSDYDCDESFISTSLSYYKYYEMALGGGKVKHTTYFGKSEDNYLIIKKTKSEVGVAFLIIPGYSEDNINWFRYKSVNRDVLEGFPDD